MERVFLAGAQNVMGYHPVECTLRFPAEGQDPEKPRHRQKVTEVRMPLLNLTAGNSRQLASILQVGTGFDVGFIF